VARILEYAEANGVDTIDTAAIYGDAETVLGELLPGDHTFRIVTKTMPCHCERVTTVERQRLLDTYYRSLERLRQPRLYGLLVHHAEDLLCPGGELLVDALCQLKAESVVAKIGVSVYSGEEIDAVARIFMPDLVQVPFNVLDQRLLQSGHLAQLTAAGVEVHARSAFLQGLLLMDVDELPDYFEPIKDHLQAFHQEAATHGLSRLAAALDFVMKQPMIHTIVVGVAALGELVEIVTTIERLPQRTMDYARWALTDRRFLNPSLWPVTERATTTVR
jgi:aryl-alcohol dehydrogenase-like predicted oxidoreductase